ncbi:MAG: tetratricopeptide repeat protein [Gemmatimonadota bacterium]
MASSPAVLKQQAAALELKKQPEKALALYQQLLSEHGGTDDVDVALRNRVGDLHLRVGQIDDAIALFERSADEYALSGFLNNAIALCNKILRQRPGHVPTLRRLARFSAEKGMVVDAQRHYLSVAELLEKLGQHGEALKALSEFAELSPEDVHVRSVVVEQLLRAGRKTDALPHLTVLHRLHAVARRTDEAEGVAQVAREIDEAWVPESEQVKEKRSDLSLILLDSDDDFGLLETSPMPGSEPERAAAVPSLEGLETTAPQQADAGDVPTGSTLDGFEATSFEAPEPPSGAPPPVAAAEPTGLPEGAMSADTLEFLEVDLPTSAPSPAPDAASALELDDPFGFNAPSAVTPETVADDDAVYSTLEVTSEPSSAAPLPLPSFDGDDLLLDMPPVEAESSAAARAAAAQALASTQPSQADGAAGSPPFAAPESPFRHKRPTPSFVNLADMLRDDEPVSARMTIGEPKQTGDEEADFQHILSEFRDGIEKTIDIDDADSHFDLGIAFREMGLVDDAIAEFQIAARSRLRRVEAIEALGGCFMDKGEPQVARTLLVRALDEPAAAQGDDTLRGVLYLLGLASEAIGAREDGLRYYQRVYAVDIRFRDVAARIQTLQQPA